MKTKMKSAFALIAVALMIMVAVVPMVSVFSDAAKVTVSDPEEVAKQGDADSTIIELNVKVYSGSGAAATSGYVKITYNSSYSQIQSYDNTDGWKFKIYESTVSSVNINVTDKDGVVDQDYPTVTLSNLTKGNSYTATLAAGHDSKTTTFKFANTDMTKGVLGGKTITATYSVYDSATATTPLETGKYFTFSYNGTTDAAVLEGTFLYPAGLETPYLKVTSFNGVSGVTFSSTGDAVLYSSGMTAQQDLVTISTTAYALGNNTAVINVDSMTVYYKSTPTGSSTAKDETVSYTQLEGKLSSSKNAYFVGIKPVTTATATVSDEKYGLKMSVDSSSYTMTATDAKTYTTAISYTPADFGKVFYGQVYAYNTAYTQAGSVSAKIFKDATNSFQMNATVDKDGYFFKFCDQVIGTGGGAMKEIKFGSYAIPGNTYDGTSAKTLEISKVKDGATGNGFVDLAEVSGTLKIAASSVTGDEDKAIIGKDIVITGSNITTFGSLKTSAKTGDEGKFNFLATLGKNAVLSVANASLTGYVSVVIGKDSDSSKVGTLYMSTQTATITLQDALGASAGSGVTISMVNSDGDAIETTKVGFVYDDINDVYKATVRGDITLTSASFVYFTGGVHTFAAKDVKTKVAYSTNAYKATTATYTIQLFDCNGNIIGLNNEGVIDAQPDNVVKLYKATAYENSAKAIIYTYDNGDEGKVPLTPGKYPSTSAKNNAYTFVASADVMKKQTLGAKPIDVIIANPAEEVLNSNIFSKYNIVTATDGYVSITAGTDSLNGTLTRLDGVTPIAGITASLYIDGSSTAGKANYTAVTQNDGSFEFISSVAFNDSGAKISKVKFTDPNGAYTFDVAPIFDTLKEKVTAYTSATETYTVTFVDADGKAITSFDGVENKKGPAIAATKIVSGTETADDGTPLVIGADGLVKYTAAWTSSTSDLTIANIVAGKASFAKHTLTAAELASGEITIVSYQSTYEFTTVDADDLKIGGITINVYGYNGDQPATVVKETLITDPLKTSAGFGTGSCRLPYYKDAADSYYCYVAVDNSISTQKYVFDTDYTPILSTSTTAESYYGKIVYFLAQADGDALEFTGDDGTYGATTIYKNGATVGFAPMEIGFGTMYFINDPSASYKVSVGDVHDETGDYDYTFAAKQAPVDGVLYAKEQWIVGNVVDAQGNSIGVPGTTVVNAYDILGAVKATGTYQAADKGDYYTMLVNLDVVDYFNVTKATWPNGYTFENSESPNIAANEQAVYFSAYTANGIALTQAVFTEPKAYDLTGALISTAIGTKGVLVDVDDVAYYKATITGVEGYNFTDSISSVFVANESLLSGTVPYTGTAGVDQKVRLDLYLGDDLVGSVNNATVNGYNYTAKLDISGMVINGIAFDSIVAVYSENGIVIAESSVDPFTQVNNIVPIFVIEYDMELLVTKVTKGHIAADVQNNIAFLSADSVFYVADDESIYTDGQYKYTFVGWYVNGVLASTQPEFYYPLVGDSTASAQYDVEYIKTSDANKDVEKEYVNVIEEVEKQAPSQGIDTNVLIIGICAVVIALIAVVYAVIRKE